MFREPPLPASPDRWKARIFLAAAQVDVASAEEAVLLGGIVRSLVQHHCWQPEIAAVCMIELSLEMRVPAAFTMVDLTLMVGRFNENYKNVEVG